MNSLHTLLDNNAFLIKLKINNAILRKKGKTVHKARENATKLDVKDSHQPPDTRRHSNGFPRAFRFQ